MFSWTALHSWQCFSGDLKPFGLRNNSVFILYVVWKLMLRSENGLKCVPSSRVVLVCTGYWLLSEEVMNISPTSAIWLLAASHLPQCFCISLAVFIPISSFSGHSQWHDTSMSDSLSVSRRTARARKLQRHTRGYLRWVLWHLSRERELCLCEQYCSLQAKPHIYTHTPSG